MIQIEDLSKSFGSQTLFEGINQRLPEGEKISLIGHNGAGKTTLLNIFCDLEKADSGQLRLRKNAVIGYLPQEPSANPQESIIRECESGAKRVHELEQRLKSSLKRLEEDHSAEALSRHEEAESAFKMAGGYSLTARAQQILEGLGFQQAQFEQSPLTLSGGWRMRLELAKIFLNQPDLLILDEPTNHLDLPSLIWVEAWLHQFPGTLIFVSHDRALLNRLSTYTLHLHGGRIDLYKGNFDAFLHQEAEAKERDASQRVRLAKKRQHHENFVRRFGAKASKATQAQSRVKMIARLRDLEAALGEDETDQVMSFEIPSPKRSGRQVLEVENLAIGYEGHNPLATGIGLEIERGQRIAVVGSNGIGKSTLIKTLAGRLQAVEGGFKTGQDVEVAYFAQNQSDLLALDRTLLDNVLGATADIGQLDARKLLGSLLFQGEEVFKEARVLSGGEKNRLGMACVLAKKANLMLLDEPTNHLDMSSVEVLTLALKEWTGSLVFVSHDRTFIDSLCTHVFVMLPDGRSRLFMGNLEDYQRAAALTGFPDVLSQESARPEAKVAEEKSQKKSSHQEIKALRTEKSRMVKKVTQLESRQAEIAKLLQELEQKSMDTDPREFQQLNDIQQEVEALNQELEANETAWLESSERVEELTEILEQQGRK